MSDAPFAVALDDYHGKARGSRYSLALLHPRELVKPNHNYSIVAEHNCASITQLVLIAAPLNAGEIFHDRVGAFGNNWANGAEENCVGRVKLSDCFRIIGIVGRRPSLDDSVGILGRTGDSDHWGKHERRG